MHIHLKPTLRDLNIKSIIRFNASGSGQSSIPSGSGLTGNGSITGRVFENGTPVSRRVMLYDRATGAYAGQVRSNDNGDYKFKRTNENLTYFVIAIDDNKDDIQYNLVGQDLLSGDHDQRGGL